MSRHPDMMGTVLFPRDHRYSQMNDGHHVWQQQALAELFLDNVRGGIPLATEQIDALLRVIRHGTANVDRLLDLGCGDGILARAVLAQYPQATAVLLDFSEHMIEAAKQKTDNQRASFVVQDLARADWTRSVSGDAPFDVVLSGFAIHHLPDERKRELYGEILGVLKPGGLFLNLEHVAPRCPWADEAFDGLFIDSLWSYDQRRGGTMTIEEITEQWYRRPDKDQNILAPVEVQCRWLEELGYRDGDCFFKLFQLALFGGKKPE